jgi:rubrerythrin
MKKFSSLDEIWDFAIAKEIEARDFYIELAEWTERPEIAKVFEDFSIDELQHKIRLEALRAGEVSMQEEEVGDLGIADSIKTFVPEANLTYAEALLVGMHREKDAFRFYTDLASISQDQEVRDTLSKLAQEEANHKLQLEIEYDLTTF